MDKAGGGGRGCLWLKRTAVRLVVSDVRYIPVTDDCYWSFPFLASSTRLLSWFIGMGT